MERRAGGIEVPELIAIDEPDDPRVEPYREVRERDLAGRRGLFLAEGEVVLGHLVRSGRFGLESLLVAERRVEKLLPLLQRLRPGTPVYVAGQAVMDRIAGFPMHRGVLGLGRRPAPVEVGAAVAGLPAEALVVALFGIGNHDNMGALFRNAAAFGADLVLLDPTCCDPLYRKAIRVSVGTVLTTPYACAPSEDLLVDTLRGAGLDLIALTPRGDEPLSSLQRNARAALLLGSEGPGLPNTVLNSARRVHIPMAPGVDSLNVAVCCAIALHHLAFSVRRT